MTKFFTYLLLFSAFACADTEPNLEVESAIARACRACDTHPRDMEWLAELIRAGDANPVAHGNFYAIPTSEGVVIIHQPWVLSCMACSRYDCQGNTPELSESVIVNELIQQMNATTLIYGTL